MRLILATIKHELRAQVERLKAWVAASRNISRYALLTGISAVVYGIVFSYFTFLRYNSFQSSAWDLGNFNQAFYSTLYGGGIFHYNADVFFSPSGSLFAIHTSPTLFLVLPFYAIYASPVTLLIIKSFAVGFSAVPLFLIARKLLESDKAGFLVALVYFLYSPLQGAIWFDFQQAALFALFAFSAYFFLLKKNWKLYFPLMLLASMVEEHLAIVMAFLAVYYFSLHGRLKSLPNSLRQKKMDEGVAAILTVIICAVYTLLALSIKDLFPVDPTFSGVYRADSNFLVLGSSETFLFPIYVLLNPLRAYAALNYDLVYKFFFVVFLLGPVLFIPLRNRFCLSVAIVLMPLLLSNYRPYYTLGIHYTFYVIPLIFIAAIYGMRRLDSKSRTFTLRTMFVVTLLFAVCTSPLSSISGYFVQQGTAMYAPLTFSFDNDLQSLSDLLSLIPSNASILTQNKIFPQVSSRLNSYVIPFSDYGEPSQMQTYLDQILSESEYVLLNVSSMTPMDEIIFNNVNRGTDYGAYALGKTAILFKRGFVGEPIQSYYVKNPTFLAYRDLMRSPSGSVVTDSSSPSGKVFLCPKGVPYCSSYGPYVYLFQGVYEVTYTVKVGDHDAGKVGTFDVATLLGTIGLSSRDVYGFEFRTGKWTNITLPFSLPRLTTGIEFRFFSRGAADVFVDSVTVKRVSSTVTVGRRVSTVSISSLTAHSGTMSPEGFLFHPHGTSDEIFWYGPHSDFSRGNYTVTFIMKISPTPDKQEEHVLDLSITGRTSAVAEPIQLNHRSLYTQDFLVNNDNSEWQYLKVNFTVDRPLTNVEYLGLSPTSAYDIYLASIIIDTLNTA